jgi:hypothetical protein
MFSSHLRAATVTRHAITLVAWYRCYAPRAGGAYDSHHRTAGIAGRTRRRGGVARSIVDPNARSLGPRYGGHLVRGSFSFGLLAGLLRRYARATNAWIAPSALSICRTK